VEVIKGEVIEQVGGGDSASEVLPDEENRNPVADDLVGDRVGGDLGGSPLSW
jgi:hypothetical protein